MDRWSSGNSCGSYIFYRKIYFGWLLLKWVFVDLFLGYVGMIVLLLMVGVSIRINWMRRTNLSLIYVMEYLLIISGRLVNFARNFIFIFLFIPCTQSPLCFVGEWPKRFSCFCWHETLWCIHGHWCFWKRNVWWRRVECKFNIQTPVFPYRFLTSFLILISYIITIK